MPWVDCSGLLIVVHSQNPSSKRSGSGNQQSSPQGDQTSCVDSPTSYTVSLIRIKFDLKPLVRQACGEAYLRSRQLAGEPLQMVYFRPMSALCDTSLLSVFRELQLYLGRRCALDIPSQHLTVQLPCRVPVGERQTLLDLYFACATMDTNCDVFIDDYRVLQLVSHHGSS